MTSRLFHTVVGVGLALGAMTMGCSAEQAPDTGTDTSDVTTYGQPTEPTKVEEKDRFCEVPWPTTKGSLPATPAQSQACIDPQRECGDYPTTESWGWDTCIVAESPTTCEWSFGGESWKICKTTGTSHEWKCPAGTIQANQCVWPDNAEPKKEARR